MEIDISLQEYLDGVKKQFGFSDDMSYQKVMTELKNEINFRESLIETVKLKGDLLMELFDNFDDKKYIESLNISDLDKFRLQFILGVEVDLNFMIKLVALKLHYLFNVSFHCMFGKIVMEIKLNEAKLNKIKRL